MKNKRAIGILAVFAVFVLAGSPAFAQATRTWVSGVGDDANPCSRTAPCKTFAGSISKTAPAGEINVLDPGGFGAVTITKAITISSQSDEGGVLVSGTNGIVIAVPNATDTVILRGLDIEGLGTGISGILVNTGGDVWVERTSINNFTDSGIKFTPTVANSALHVSDCYIRNNGTFAGVSSTGQGILVSPSGAATATLDKVRLEHNVSGLKTTGGTTSVINSTASNNFFGGFAANSGGSILTVERSRSNQNGTGVVCNPTTTVRMGNNTITDNGTAVSTGGTCQTFKNNDIDAPGILGLTVVVQQ